MTGSIVTFDDAIPFMPIESIVAQITPVQDLHGYDSPWPAGGGKNKLLFDVATTTKNGVKCTNLGDGTYKLTGTASAVTTFEVSVQLENGAAYVLNGCPSGGSASTYRLDTYGTNVPQTNDYGSGANFTADGNVQRVRIVVFNGNAFPSDGVVFKPMIRLASVTDPTFAPYSNECPISGWTGMNGKRTGKNLGIGYAQTYSVSGVTFTGDGAGGVEITGTSTSVYPQVSFNVPSDFLPHGTQFTLSTTTSGNVPSGAKIYAILYERDKIYGANVETYSSKNGAVTFTISHPYSLLILVAEGNNITYTGTNTKAFVQIERGTFASDFEPVVEKETLSVSWQDTAGTVYGGSMTVNEDGSGELVSARAKKIFDGTEALSYNRDSATSGYAIYRLGAKNAVAVSTSGLSNILKPVTSGLATADWAQMVQNSGAFNQDQIAFRFSYDFDGGTASGTVTNYKAELARLYAAETPLEVCYELATPQTYHFDNLEQLTTLIGTNNVWVDTGDVTVTYQSTTSRSEYIVGMIGRPIEVFDENTELPENTSDVLEKTIDVFDEHEVEKIDNPLLKNTIELYDPKEIDESEKPEDTFNDTVDIFD